MIQLIGKCTNCSKTSTPYRITEHQKSHAVRDRAVLHATKLRRLSHLYPSPKLAVDVGLDTDNQRYIVLCGYCLPLCMQCKESSPFRRSRFMDKRRSSFRLHMTPFSLASFEIPDVVTQTWNTDRRRVSVTDSASISNHSRTNTVQFYERSE